jgi:hypothetical protein
MQAQIRFLEFLHCILIFCVEPFADPTAFPSTVQAARRLLMADYFYGLLQAVEACVLQSNTFMVIDCPS